jgi:hypothetical protein
MTVDAKKAVSSVDLTLKVIAFAKMILFATGLALIDLARRKQKIAELKERLAEDGLKLERRKEDPKKSPDEVIENYLKGI